MERFSRRVTRHNLECTLRPRTLRDDFNPLVPKPVDPFEVVLLVESGELPSA